MREEFELTDDDWEAIEIAKELVRQFLRSPTLSPRQIIGLGHAIFALERMPKVTPGAHCEFGIDYKSGTAEFNDYKYISFFIGFTRFEISVGGSVYDHRIGSDSFSLPGWVVDRYEYGYEKCDLYRLENEIQEYLNLGALISVSDESEIDFGELAEWDEEG